MLNRHLTSDSSTFDNQMKIETFLPILIQLPIVDDSDVRFLLSNWLYIVWL